jgi:endoglucanase
MTMAKRSDNEARDATPLAADCRLSRRRLLKAGIAVASSTLLQPRFASAFVQQKAFRYEPGPSQPNRSALNPRWYGFNLLEYFSTDPDWMKYFPYQNDGMFREDDFRWIRDWGFNWVRLPMDYRFWTAPDLFTIHEKRVGPIDRAVRLGEKYGIHVNICLHRAPGLCILDTMDEKLTGIAVTKEKTNVFGDSHTFEAFIHQWTYFAKRYKGISSQKLSFNLVNEPVVLPNDSERAEMEKNGPVKTSELFSPEFLRSHAKDYTRLAAASAKAIRDCDAERLVVTDGYPGAGTPVLDLFATGMLQSCHTYTPIQVTHHNCEWVRGLLTGSEPTPTWPLKDANGNIVYDRQKLEQTFHPWAGLAAEGVPIHFGEMGCYKYTPPETVLAWFNDTLEVLGNLNSGWALWNFRGPFGVVDTERAGTKFEDWRGHKLDRPLLSLLQKKMKT